MSYTTIMTSPMWYFKQSGPIPGEDQTEFQAGLLLKKSLVLVICMEVKRTGLDLTWQLHFFVPHQSFLPDMAHFNQVLFLRHTIPARPTIEELTTSFLSLFRSLFLFPLYWWPPITRIDDKMQSDYKSFKTVCEPTGSFDRLWWYSDKEHTWMQAERWYRQASYFALFRTFTLLRKLR